MKYKIELKLTTKRIVLKNQLTTLHRKGNNQHAFNKTKYQVCSDATNNNKFAAGYRLCKWHNVLARIHLYSHVVGLLMVSKTSRSSESKTFSQPSVNHEKLENIDQIKKYLRYEVG